MEQLHSHEQAAAHGDRPKLDAGSPSEAALDAAGHPRHCNVPKALQLEDISRFLLYHAPAGPCITCSTSLQRSA